MPVLPVLGPEYFDIVSAARFPQHIARYRNQRWASRVALDTLDAAEWERHFAAFAPLPDNLAEPLALRYHGHQFRTYNPDLGDGRGFLFAQVAAADGRLTLKGGVREVLASEMLEALGVYTSKAFSLFETGERLFRNDEPSPARSSVLVRLGHSHLRIGTFQRCAFFGETQLLRRLLEHCVAHYVPEAAAADDRAAAFAAAVGRRRVGIRNQARRHRRSPRGIGIVAVKNGAASGVAAAVLGPRAARPLEPPSHWLCFTCAVPRAITETSSAAGGLRVDPRAVVATVRRALAADA